MTSKVLARCFNGKTYELSPGADATVGSLQAMISKESGIDADRQTLLFNRAVLSDPSAPLSSINIPDGATVSVVRRVGKAGAASSAASRPTPAAARSTTSTTPASGASGAAGAGGLEEMMRSMGLGAGAGGAGGGAGGPNPAAMQQMQQMMQMLGGGAGGGLGGGPGAAGGGGGGDMMTGIQNMMQSLFSSPAMQEYLNDPEKQEQSRQMLASNPLLTQMMGGADMEAAISDPAKWKESMNAARQLVSSLPASAEGTPAAGGATGDTAATAAKDAKDAKDAPAPSPLAAATAAAKASPRDGSGMTPPAGVDMDKLSLAYGHALGQSLVNSGLGLDPRRVVVGFEGSALHNKEFPMPLPEYERQMGVLQNVATEYLARVNMEDATRFFEEAGADSSIRVLEEGRVLVESGEVAPDASKPAAEADATVLVLLQGRLLDGRFFYTYPSADESGDNVHPLTLPLNGAPPALTAGLLGMHEGEERTLYVHPSASEGMADMFGDLLPPNALLIFDLELVSASAPPEEEVTADAPAAAEGAAAPATAAA